MVKPQNYFTMIILNSKVGELYYIGNSKPLTTEGKLKSVGMLADIFCKNRLRRLDFNIPVGKVTVRQAVMLNKAQEELPSASDITGVDDIQLQETSFFYLNILYASG